jgi:hypothetical protein
MDSTLEQMLEGFRFTVHNYKSSLGPDNEKLLKAMELMDSLWSKAEQGADMTRISMDPEFGQVAALLGELASEPPLPPEELEALARSGEPGSDDDIPPASIPAAGYHMAFDALPPDIREQEKVYYDRIFQLEEKAENAIHFNTLLMEDTVLLDMSRIPLQKLAEETLAQAESVHSPTVNFQQKLAAETFRRVQTIAELEFEATKMAELSNTEHPWDALYLEVMGLLPACAQAIESFGPNEDSIAKLRNSHRFMAEFMGTTWDDVFADSRYMLFWNNVFWPKVPPEKRALHQVTSAEGWRDLLKAKFYDPFVGDEPVPRSDPSKAIIRFWGREFPARQTLDLLSNPPRPDINRDTE